MSEGKKKMYKIMKGKRERWEKKRKANINQYRIKK